MSLINCRLAHVNSTASTEGKNWRVLDCSLRSRLSIRSQERQRNLPRNFRKRADELMGCSFLSSTTSTEADNGRNRCRAWRKGEHYREVQWDDRVPNSWKARRKTERLKTVVGKTSARWKLIGTRALCPRVANHLCGGRNGHDPACAISASPSGFSIARL